MARVSRSGYYKWLKRQGKGDRDYADYLRVKRVFDASRGKLGYRRIKMKLQAQRIVMNHKKILRIKRKYGLVTKVRRHSKFRVFVRRTLEHRTFPNLLRQDFAKRTPYTFFSTDITYLAFRGGRAFLSVVKDLASGEIISHEVSQSAEPTIVINTLDKMAQTLALRNVSPRGICIHSDQGVQYTSPAFFNSVRRLGMVQSMSRKGNCLDNASIESFFGHLKDEIELKQCRTLKEVTRVVDGYIAYYNTGRHQWRKKKMTPVDYRNHLLS